MHEIADQLEHRTASYLERENRVSSSNLAPVAGIDDCKCFAVKVTENRENEIILRIMNKFKDFIEREKDWPLISVFASSTKGYIYAECNNKTQIEGILYGMRDVYSGRVELVDINNITEVKQVLKVRY